MFVWVHPHFTNAEPHGPGLDPIEHHSALHTSLSVAPSYSRDFVQEPKPLFMKTEKDED